jgi:hypothetical protein
VGRPAALKKIQDGIVAKLWPEKTDTVRDVGPTICNETGNGPNSSLAATCLIVID